MQQLQRFDHQDRLAFVALNEEKEMQAYPMICPDKANRILHAQSDTGQLFLGLDATYAAWRMVNKHRWLAILRWPVIRFFADIGYRFFAKHRYRISYLLTGDFLTRKKPCATCSIPTKKNTSTDSDNR